tara:strand:- start:1066 stop:1506 length:441 start_codon:yes stop_codon:yes gene_type:complete
MLENNVLIASLVSWMAAQALKVAGGVIRHRRFSFRWVMSTGGMPSAHSAGVSALATGVGLTSGFSTPLFAVAFAFAMVTMFDAQGVRRSAGQQAKILNAVMEDIYFGRPVPQERMRELLGHTPVEVFVGGAIGVCLAALLCLKVLV